MNNAELIKRIEELERLVVSMQNYNSITPEFRNVLQRANLASSSKGATSENQTVNEGGAASYAVLKGPDAYIQATVGSTTYYIPVFT